MQQISMGSYKYKGAQVISHTLVYSQQIHMNRNEIISIFSLYSDVLSPAVVHLDPLAITLIFYKLSVKPLTCFRSVV